MDGIAASGTHTVALRVSDGRGASATQSYEVTVSTFGDNHAPRIVSTPVEIVIAGLTYEYGVQAVDDDGDSLTFSLQTAPDGMDINPTTGVVTWDTTQDDVGVHPVALRVMDSESAWASQSFDLVCQVNAPPEILSTTPPPVAIIDYPYVYGVQASDPGESRVGGFVRHCPSSSSWSRR